MPAHLLLPGKPSPRPPRPEPREGHIAVGYILGAHGLEGELKVDSLSDNPERFRTGAVLRAGDRSITIRSLRAHRGALLVRIDGIDHPGPGRSVTRPATGDTGVRTRAARRRTSTIVSSSSASKYATPEGTALGTLQEVLETGANDVYIVRDDESELLVPAIEAVVKQVSIADKTMVIEPLPGMERRPLRNARSP